MRIKAVKSFENSVVQIQRLIAADLNHPGNLRIF
jgi:hypothetical protein